LAPVLLGQGEPLLHGLDLHALGFCVTNRKASEYADAADRASDPEFLLFDSKRTASRDNQNGWSSPETDHIHGKAN
jgi:hypothetical protein